jgi:hypothetical protein
MTDDVLRVATLTVPCLFGLWTAVACRRAQYYGLPGSDATGLGGIVGCVFPAVLDEDSARPRLGCGPLSANRPALTQGRPYRGPQRQAWISGSVAPNVIGTGAVDRIHELCRRCRNQVESRIGAGPRRRVRPGKDQHGSVAGAAF